MGLSPARAASRDSDSRLWDIVRQLQSGSDRETNARLIFDRCCRLVHHYFRQRGYPPAEREDLVQETFLRVFNGIAGFRYEARFETWVLQIASRVHRAQCERRGAVKRAATTEQADLTEEASANDQTAPSPLSRVLATEQIQLLRSALEGFPPQMRRCAFLRYFQQLHYREIAILLGTSVDSVKVQLSRARNRLRRELSSDRPCRDPSRAFPRGHDRQTARRPTSER